MIHRKFIQMCFFCILNFVCLTGWCENEIKKIEIELSFCNFNIPPVYLIGNCSFSVSVSFKPDTNGIPNDIKVHELYGPHKILNIKEIIACISKWRVKGFPQKSQITAIWRWKHAIGWLPLTIIGPGFKQTINADAISINTD